MRPATTNQASFPQVRHPLPPSHPGSRELLSRLSRLSPQSQASDGPLNPRGSLPPVQRVANVLHVHLCQAAAQLSVAEEQLRDALLSLPGSHMRGAACYNRREPFVSIPYRVWHQLPRGDAQKIPQIASCAAAASPTKYYPGKVQEQMKPPPLLQPCTQTPPLVRKPIGFGFASGSSGPNAVLGVYGQMNRKFQAEREADVDWMERYMPMENKSTALLDRSHEASKTNKLSVSDYHDRVLLHKEPTTPAAMRPFSTLKMGSYMAKDRLGRKPATPPCLRSRSVFILPRDQVHNLYRLGSK